jgi:hypothetical protein
MPLPNSGAGETLPGGPGGARTGSAGGGLLRQETLFGISPEQMAGRDTAENAGKSTPEPPLPTAKPPAAKPTAAAKPLSAKPAAQAAIGQTFFGVAPPGLYPERRKVEVEATPAAAPAPAGVAAPAPGDAAIANRTLLGVVPDDIARAVAAAREKAPATARVAATPAPPPPASPAPPRAGGAGPVQVARTAFEAAPPAAARGGMPAHTAFEGTAPAAPAGTVRSLADNPAGSAAPAMRGPIPPGAESLDLEPDAEGDASGEPALPIHAKTQLGVAIPGIAPLHAGVSQKPAAAGSPRRTWPLDETQLQPDSFTAAPLSARPNLPRGAFVLLGSGLALLLAAAAFALLWKSSKPLSVAISADASGKDRIDLVCQECPDGTLVSLSSARAEIAGRKAYLTLPEPLPLGDNHVSFGLQMPGAREPEVVSMTLPPVEYRIRPDTSTLVGDQPRLTLKIAAIAGSKVEIARQPVGLDAAGNGEIAVDLTGELIGPASEVVSFEQSIAYRIAPPSGKTYEGELAFKIGVTPLLLEAPGIDTVTDMERFMLAGRTTKGAELWVAGTTIAVDAGGRFAQLMSIDSVGETRVTVRATEPGLAPRFVSFRLQRVQSLENEATQRRQKALPLADVRRRIADHVGSSVVVSGRVEEVRVDGHRSLILLQPDAGCDGRSCLVRLVYGGLRKLARGQAVTAIGRLQGSVAASAGSGGEVPEVDVSLLL